MPELPEVETIRRGLVPRLIGKRVMSLRLNGAGLRFPFPAGLERALVSRRIEALRRRGKYLLLDLDAPPGQPGHSLLLHLGMSGRLRHHPEPPEPMRHDHVVMGLEDGGTLVFNDARRFGVLDLLETAEWERHRLLCAMGPEPLAPDFTPEVLAARLAGRRTPLKAALLDQRVVAGLGNIYVCEALFLSGLAPDRDAGGLDAASVSRLAGAIRNVLDRALVAGGSTLRDYVQSGGEQGWFQLQFSVYAQEGKPCPGCTCGAPIQAPGIQRLVQGGRSTYYCPHRQK